MSATAIHTVEEDEAPSHAVVVPMAKDDGGGNRTDSNVTDETSNVTPGGGGDNGKPLERDDHDDAVLLGRERHVLDRHVEVRGVKEMLETLTEEERAQMPDIRMAIRHFRAEKGHTEKAIEKLRNALQWRKEFGVDVIVKASQLASSKGSSNDLDDTMGTSEVAVAEILAILREENDTGKIYVRGYDAEGRALMYMRPSRENTRHEMNNMRHLVFNFEKAIACTCRKSMEIAAAAYSGSGDGAHAHPPPSTVVPLEKINLLIDYDGFKLSHSPPMSTTRYTLDILQKHYPERMYRAYVINPPLVFRTFWALIKHFVDPVTKEKIIFCHGKKGMAILHEAVNRVDKLESVVGGTAPVPEFDSRAYFALPLDVSFDED